MNSEEFLAILQLIKMILCSSVRNLWCLIWQWKEHIKVWSVSGRNWLAEKCTFSQLINLLYELHLLWTDDKTKNMHKGLGTFPEQVCILNLRETVSRGCVQFYVITYRNKELFENLNRSIFGSLISFLAYFLRKHNAPVECNMEIIQTRCIRYMLPESYEWCDVVFLIKLYYYLNIIVLPSRQW